MEPANLNLISWEDLDQKDRCYIIKEIGKIFYKNAYFASQEEYELFLENLEKTRGCNTRKWFELKYVEYLTKALDDHHENE